MQAALLRHRVTFQNRSAVQDSFGGQQQVWADAFTVYAAIVPTTGREIYNAQAIHAEVSHQVIVRYRSELANPTAVAAMRIVYQGRIFNIVASVNENERKRMVTLFAQEGLNSG